MTDLSRPRGTRDFGPDEMAARRAAESAMRRVMALHGYGEIQTPTFEHADLFIARSGPQVLDQIYDFKDKGDRHMALRPELTAPVMRFYSSELKNDPKPLRVFYFGNCFRYERPQKGRYREFWQMGMEYIGKRTILANAEVVNISIACLLSAGVEGFRVRIGHVALLSSLLKQYGIDPKADKEVMIAIDKKDRSGLERTMVDRDPGPLLDLIMRTYPSDEAKDELTLIAKAHPSLTEVCEELRDVLSLLPSSGTEVLFDPSISRGLDYYDGMVFEIDIPTLGAEKQVCGGGVYSLSSVFGSEVEGIGFGIGFDRVLMASGDRKKEDSPHGVLVIPMDESVNRYAFDLQRIIVGEGVRCILETQGRGLRKSLSSAQGLNVRYAVILGTDEMKDNSVTLKDLTAMTQVKAPYEEVIQLLKGKPFVTLPENDESTLNNR